MGINRFQLIQAITEARRHQNHELYDELLKIYYRLLEQEQINDSFITEFVTHSTVSETARNKLSEQILFSLI